MSYETFLLSGGPLDGHHIELVNDVFHPCTETIEISKGGQPVGAYRRRPGGGQRWMEWVEA